MGADDHNARAKPNARRSCGPQMGQNAELAKRWGQDALMPAPRSIPHAGHLCFSKRLYGFNELLLPLWPSRSPCAKRGTGLTRTGDDQSGGGRCQPQ